MPEDQPSDLGAELAQAREQRGITLAELSRRTKIGVDTLKAIERGDMTALPGGLYTRAFLRAYAREVGCNPDDIVGRFREKFKEQDVAKDVIAQLESGVSLTCAPGQVHVKDIDAMTRRRSRTAWVIGLGIVLLGAGIHFSLTPSASWRSTKQKSASSAASTANPSSPSTTNADPKAAAPSAAAVEPQPTATTGGTTGPTQNQAGVTGSPQNPPVAQPGDSAAMLRLDVKPSGDCWLSVTADGQRVIYRLLTASDRTQVEAKDDIALVVGDPGTCAFDLNGTGVRRLGEPGQPVSVHLTRQNYEQFLDRSSTVQHQ